MNQIVSGAREVRTGIEVLHSPEECHVSRQQVFEWTMNLTHLPHEDATGFFDNFGIYQSWVSFESVNICPPLQHCIALIDDAARANRTRGARNAKRNRRPDGTLRQPARRPE